LLDLASDSSESTEEEEELEFEREATWLTTGEVAVSNYNYDFTSEESQDRMIGRSRADPQTDIQADSSEFSCTDTPLLTHFSNIISSISPPSALHHPTMPSSKTTKQMRKQTAKQATAKQTTAKPTTAKQTTAKQTTAKQTTAKQTVKQTVKKTVKRIIDQHLDQSLKLKAILAERDQLQATFQI